VIILINYSSKESTQMNLQQPDHLQPLISSQL